MPDLYVAHQGSGQDGQLYFTFTPDGSNWAPDRQVPTSGMSDSPSALFFNNRLYFFYQGSGEDGQLRYTSTADATDWAPEEQVPNGMSAGPGARVGFNNRLYCFHQGSGQDGQLWYTSTSDGIDWAQDQQIPTSGMSVGPDTAIPDGASTASTRAAAKTVSSGTPPPTMASTGPRTSRYRMSACRIAPA